MDDERLRKLFKLENKIRRLHELVGACVALGAGYAAYFLASPHWGDWVSWGIEIAVGITTGAAIQRSIDFHKVSRKYLPLYVAEFQFRYNNRENDNIFAEAIQGC